MVTLPVNAVFALSSHDVVSRMFFFERGETVEGSFVEMVKFP